MKKMKGFTLVEIMIVVAIIGLLVAIGVPGFMKARDNARKNSCYNNMRVIAHAIQQYTIDESCESGFDVPLYGNIMPALGGARDNTLYVPKPLVCPEDNDESGYTPDPCDNNDLAIACGSDAAVAANTHGTFGALP